MGSDTSKQVTSTHPMRKLGGLMIASQQLQDTHRFYFEDPLKVELVHELRSINER